MCLEAVTDTVTGDNSDAAIDLGYEKNVQNGPSDFDNESLHIPIAPTLFANLICYSHDC